jgi:pyruvate/2-oxoglutarate dehydrogenase complex dihydrolipoamide acyltransferase (E2) component
MTVPEYNRLTHEVIDRILAKIKEAGKVTSQDGSNLRQLINCHQLLPAEATDVWMRLCKVFVGDEPRLRMLHYFTGKLQPQPSPEQQYTLSAYQVALLTLSAYVVCDFVDADLRDLQLAIRVLPSLPPVFPDKSFNDAAEPAAPAAEPTDPPTAEPAAAEPAASPASPASAAQAADDEPDAKRQRTD